MSHNLKNTSKLPSFDPYQASKRTENRTGHMEKRGPAVYTPNLNCRIKKQIAEPYSLKLFSQGGKLKEEDKFYGNVKQNNALQNLLTKQKQDVKMENQHHNTRHIKKEKKLSDLMSLYFKGELEKRSQDSATKYLRSQMTPLEKEIFDNSEVDKMKYMQHMVGTNEVAMNHYRTKQAVMDYFTVQKPAAQPAQENALLKDLVEGVKEINKKGQTVDKSKDSNKNKFVLPEDTLERERASSSAQIFTPSESTPHYMPSPAQSIAQNNTDAMAEMFASANLEALGLGHDILGVFDDLANMITEDPNYEELANVLETMKQMDYDADQVSEEQIAAVKELVDQISETWEASPIEILQTTMNNLGVDDGQARSWLYHMYPSEMGMSVRDEGILHPEFSRDFGTINAVNDPGNIGQDVGLLMTGREIAHGAGFFADREDGREPMPEEDEDDDDWRLITKKKKKTPVKERMKRSGFQFGEVHRAGSKKNKGKQKAESSGLDKFTKPKSSVENLSDGLQRVMDALSFSPPPPKTSGGRYKG